MRGFREQHSASVETQVFKCGQNTGLFALKVPVPQHSLEPLTHFIALVPPKVVTGQENGASLSKHLVSSRSVQSEYLATQNALVPGHK